MKILSFLWGEKNLKTLSVHPPLFLLVWKAVSPTIHPHIQWTFYVNIATGSIREINVKITVFCWTGSVGNCNVSRTLYLDRNKTPKGCPSSLHLCHLLHLTEVTLLSTGKAHVSSKMFLGRPKCYYLQKQMELQKQMRLPIHQIQFTANSRSWTLTAPVWGLLQTCQLM